jgi:hypothetical protein
MGGRRRIRLIAATGLAVALGLATAAAAQARLLAFKSPSGNITCVISTSDGGFAQCELRNMPHDGGFAVDRQGRVDRYDVAYYDDLASRRFVLRYGRSAQLDGFRCTSRVTGMTCRSLENRHGFTISRQGQRVFSATSSSARATTAFEIKAVSDAVNQALDELSRALGAPPAT